MNTKFEISAQVQKILKEKNLNADDVLRKALNVKVEGFTTPDGTHFPEGTILIAWYKGHAVSAVIKSGNINVDGKVYPSLSAAAAHFTGRPTTNGWDFWFVKAPGKSEFISANRLVDNGHKAA